MRSQDDVRPTFTVIYHDKRIELGLNLLEYILADTIFYLSQNSKGYCYKSIRSMARDLGMSFHGVHEALNRLIVKELLLKVEGGFKCADSFIEAVYLKRDPKRITQRKGRSIMEQTDPPGITSDP